MNVNDLNFRERYFLKDLEMAIVGDDELGVARNGTINKFIVIRIFRNQVPLKIPGNHFNVRSILNDLQNGLRYLMSHVLLNDLFVFRQDIGGNA